MSEDKNKFINDAGKNGLILAAVAAIYFLVTTFMGKIEHGGFILTLLSFVLWAAKFSLCIWLMAGFLRAFAAENEYNRSKTFRYGANIALCSSLVYSGFYLLYVTVIDTGFFSGVFDSVAQVYSSFLTSEEMERMMNMESSMPTVSFFVNFIWCSLVGIIISAVAAGKICGSDDPFANDNR